MDRSLHIEPVFRAALRSNGLPQPEREYQFHPTRRWRFDYAFPKGRVALEVEGGAFVQGRHTRGAGFRTDLEKYSEAAAMGWLIIRVLPEQLCAQRTIDWIRRALKRSSAVTRSRSSRY